MTRLLVQFVVLYICCQSLMPWRLRIRVMIQSAFITSVMLLGGDPEFLKLDCEVSLCPSIREAASRE